MKKAGAVKGIIKVQTPIGENEIKRLRIGDRIEIYGFIYCGRDAVLPKLVRLIESDASYTSTINLRGAVIFHTAVSPAGIGPTTSNKVEIEGSMPMLSKAGVKLHVGKGALSVNTVSELRKHNSVFAIAPPTSALFSDRILHQRIVLFREEGMEALYELKAKGLPAIIAVAHGESIF
jgi:fumarate hydratase subunit beta